MQLHAMEKFTLRDRLLVLLFMITSLHLEHERGNDVQTARPQQRVEIRLI